MERELMVLGEALCQLHRIAPDVAMRINRYNDIIGFRHILVHGYDVLDMEIVWGIIQQDLPLLIQQIALLLQNRTELR